MSITSDSELKYFDQLFGSKTRVKLLRLFLIAPELRYYVRELCRITSEHLNSVRRELDSLEKLGLIIKDATTDSTDGQKVFYRINKNFILFNELKALFIKSQLLLERTLLEELGHIGNLQLLVLTGLFTGNKTAATDILIVGRIKTGDVDPLIRRFEKDLGRDLNYTILSPQEFAYRRDLTDLFLYNILENKKIVLIDNINIEKKEARKDYGRKKIAVKKTR